jgi:hypothetical protein
MSDRILRTILLGPHKVPLAAAVIDTGTALVVVPRPLAKWAEINLGRRVRGGEIEGFGSKTDKRGKKTALKGSVFRALVEVEGSGCSTETEVFVPDSDEWRDVLVGSRFFQQTGARILYDETPHRVACDPAPKRRRRENPAVEHFVSYGEYPLGNWPPPSSMRCQACGRTVPVVRGGKLRAHEFQHRRCAGSGARVA